jgi:hypothetical protein
VLEALSNGVIARDRFRLKFLVDLERLFTELVSKRSAGRVKKKSKIEKGYNVAFAVRSGYILRPT